MDIQIILTTAAGPQEVAKFVEALKGLGSLAAVEQHDAPINPTTQPPAGTFFPGSAPINPQPLAAPMVAPVTPQNPVPPTYTTAGTPPWESPAQPPIAPAPAPAQQQYAPPPYYPPQAPVAAPQPQQAPPPAPVPTAVPDYSHEQLGRAIAAFIDKAAGNREKAMACMQAQGVQAISQLATKEQRAAFANALRQLGVQI